MKNQNTVIHCCTQQDMEIGCCVSDCRALEKITELLSLHPVAAFRLYVCSYNPQSMMSPVKQQDCMYLRYLLVITHMFSANVQATITSYLARQNEHLPDLN